MAELSEKHIARMQERFGKTLNVQAEIRAATGYAKGRPYKNFARFVWNWCVRSELFAARKAAAGYKPDPVIERPPLVEARMLSREDLEKGLLDESETVREFAREQLKLLDGAGQLGQN
jgi:hypothetical protein